MPSMEPWSASLEYQRVWLMYSRTTNVRTSNVGLDDEMHGMQLADKSSRIYLSLQ